MRILAILGLLSVNLILLGGCDTFTGYPDNEPCLTNKDIHKSGRGDYGGTASPASPATQKSDAGKI